MADRAISLRALVGGRTLVWLLAFASGCGSDPMPPKKVEAAPAEPNKAAKQSTVATPQGATYRFDPACDKCKRVRGDGCVTRVSDDKPLGCGWVAPDGKRAAMAWVVRDPKAPRTFWWYGSDGQTKSFWTPCKDAACEATVAWEPDGKTAAVTATVPGADPVTVRYDVDASKPL